MKTASYPQSSGPIPTSVQPSQTLNAGNLKKTRAKGQPGPYKFRKCQLSLTSAAHAWRMTRPNCVVSHFSAWQLNIQNRILTAIRKQSIWFCATWIQLFVTDMRHPTSKRNRENNPEWSVKRSFGLPAGTETVRRSYYWSVEELLWIFWDSFW